MSGRLLFYVKHAFYSLQRERRRSLFAVFTIAVGVAAIVSLQSLSLSIEESVTGDIQATHQADIVVSSRDEPFSPHERAALDDLASQGSFAEWTYFYGANPDRPSFIAPSRDGRPQPLQWVQPYLIEPHKYPLYGELRSLEPEGVPIGQLLTSPGSIVLSRGVASRLGVAIGDEVILENSNTFLVRGIVSNEAAGGFFAPYNVPPMPWYAYLNIHDTKVRDVFGVEGGEATHLFVKTLGQEDPKPLAEKIRLAVPSVDVETAGERLPELERATRGMRKAFLIVGLLSLAIGGIGILNTMLVVVGRRTTEVAILKALGLRGRQVIYLFLVEGAMLGVAGSVMGVLLGILVSYGLTGFSEQFLQSQVPWRVYGEPIYTGLVVGIIATTVFGFLPVLAASRVRPNVILQPQGSVLPRAGRTISIVVVLLLTAVMGLVASVLLGDLVVGMLGAYVTLVVLALLTAMLLAVVWVVGKAPSFGSINLKLSLRSLARQKGRAASTLLALLVGIFAMSSIIILSDTMKQLIDKFAEEEAGGNVFVFFPHAEPEARDRAFEEISALEGVSRYTEFHEFRADKVAVNGRPIGPDEMATFLDWRDLVLVTRGGTPSVNTSELAAGRHLGPEDVGKPVVVVGPAQPWLRVGDELSFNMGDTRASLEIVGITLDSVPLEQGAFSNGGNFVAPLGAVDPTIAPDSIGFTLAVPESEALAIADRLNREVPGAIAMEAVSAASIFKEVLDKFTIFPIVLSGLALFAGAVIIANSVALATMERRREIAMMKAVGAKGSRILTALLMENGIIGLVGGAIGVGLSLLMLAIFDSLEPEIPATPEPLSIIAVLAVAIGVAMGAAVLSAWPASRERPLNVLRYE